MGFLAAVGSSYVNILNFSGRARRAEFWWFMLFQFLVNIGAALAFMAYVFAQPGFTDPNAAVVMPAEIMTYTAYWSVGQLVFMTLPGLSCTVRRLHDTDHSGWWYLIILVPIVGILVLLFFLVMPGTPGRNSYGHSPIYGSAGAMHAPGGSMAGSPTKAARGKSPALNGPAHAKIAAREAKRREEMRAYYQNRVLPQQP